MLLHFVPRSLFSSVCKVAYRSKSSKSQSHRRTEAAGRCGTVVAVCSRSLQINVSTFPQRSLETNPIHSALLLLLLQGVKWKWSSGHWMVRCDSSPETTLSLLFMVSTPRDAATHYIYIATMLVVVSLQCVSSYPVGILMSIWNKINVIDTWPKRFYSLTFSL